MESTASVWEDPHCPFRVEWAPDKLNRMRIAVVDAFYSLPRGGIEIGGLLLGEIQGKVMRIENFAPMECEHLTGPSFVLSPKDESALERQLAALDGEVLGWFHSHTRSEIHFSAHDTDIHNRFFRKPSHLAMVLRPANSQPPRANYFFRGPGGVMTGGSTPFVVEPVLSKGIAAAPVPAVKLPEGPVTPVPIADAVPVESPVQVEFPVELEVPVEIAPPVFLQQPEPAPGRSFLWLSIVLLVAALSAAAFFTRDLWMPN